MRFVVKIRVKIERFILPKIYRVLPLKKCKKTESPYKLIVSLTTYGKRLENVDICVRSLLRQRKMPDRILLYLGDDVTDEMIPDKLKRLQEYGLIIKKGYEDIKPHKKYYYAMQEYPDATVITVDDDAIYDDKLVESLWDMHEQYPDTIVARTVKRMLSDEHGILSYNEWEYLASHVTSSPGMEYLAVGIGGTLYPAGCMPEKCFDRELIKKCCLDIDDLWLKFMEIEENIPVVHCPSDYFVPVMIERKQKEGLFEKNVLENKNDVGIKKIQKELGVELVSYAKNRVQS